MDLGRDGILPRRTTAAMDPRHERFARAIAGLQDELDWERLGRAYCAGDGTTFFDAELRERWLDTGLRIADELSRHLTHGSGRSVYIGAALAEIPLMLVEQLVLGREVTWVNLPCDEIAELERVVRLVGERSGVALPVPSTKPLESLPRGAFDHVWLVSVLTDPDHFPALHDELYERHGTDLATGRGSLNEDRERAERLVRAALGSARTGALISTSVDELDLWATAARGEPALEPVRGTSAAEADLLTAIVGDPLAWLRVGAASSGR
jgi:hypothetical protein